MRDRASFAFADRPTHVAEAAVGVDLAARGQQLDQGSARISVLEPAVATVRTCRYERGLGSIRDRWIVGPASPRPACRPERVRCCCHVLPPGAGRFLGRSFRLPSDYADQRGRYAHRRRHLNRQGSVCAWMTSPVHRLAGKQRRLRLRRRGNGGLI